jgi:site-specific DNA recombinase
MRAFCYCRVSTEEQSTADHYSLGNQEQKARDYARAKGWTIARVRKDVASGKDTDRPGFQDLLSAIRAREIDLVVVYRLDRLSRNVRDIYDVLDAMRKHDVGFVSISEGFDTTTAMGRAMLGVAAVFAQLTREMIAENVKDGLMRRAESGKWNGPKWNPPYGYRYVTGGTIEPVPEQAAVVRDIFRWFTESKWGTSKIARYLNTQGVRRECGMKGSGQWHQSKVWETLQNPVYAGKLNAGDRLVEGSHERLIDEALWSATQEMVASRRKQAPRTKASPHLLSGLVRCGTCGRLLAAQKASYDTSSGKRRYVGFRHSRNEFAGERHCAGAYHRGDTLEAAVIEALFDIARTSGIRQAALEEARKRSETEGAPLRAERERLESRLADADRKFGEWARRLDEGIIDEAQFKAWNETLRAEKARDAGRLREVEEKLGADQHLDVTVAELERVWEDLPQVWENLEFEERRELLRLLVEKVSIFPDHVDLQPHHLPLRTLETRRSGRVYRRKATANAVASMD